MSKPPTAGLGSSTSKGPAESDDGRSTTPVAAAGQTATVQNPAAASAASSQAQSSSLLTSTSAGPESSSASSNTASGNTSTQTPHATQKSSNTGLIAGIAVLAVLLAIALAAIGFLILRKKRRDPHKILVKGIPNSITQGNHPNAASTSLHMSKRHPSIPLPLLVWIIWKVT